MSEMVIIDGPVDVDIWPASKVPTVPRLASRILEALKAGGGINMSGYHTCSTVHCLAGWAVHLGCRSLHLDESLRKGSALFHRHHPSGGRGSCAQTGS